MKRLILISASLVITSAAFAQSDANSDNSLYKFDNAGTPKEVRKLGSAPEFPFLRNMTSSEQVYAAIKRNERNNTAGMDKLNDLLMQIGYTNGTKDLHALDISEAYVQPGTEGNMGSRGYTYSYYRLEGSPSEFKAWKIVAKNNGTMDDNGSLYIFAKCGNAFFPKTAAKTACINVPVTLTPDMNQVTLNNSGTTVTSTDKVFVYYGRKRHKRHEGTYPIAGVDTKYPSRPIMLSAAQNTDVMPQTYTVSMTAPQNTVSACVDATLNLTANINVEKTSSYTGNYPNKDNKTYKKVSKRTYKMVARRSRRIERKEDKIARKTGTAVDVKVAKI